MLLSKEVEITWENINKKRYIEKEYKYTKVKDKFNVKVEDLSEGSHVLVEVLCDYCKESIIKKQYNTYLLQNKKSNIHKDCCDKCWNLKLAESMNQKYGENNASLVSEFQEKRTNTFIDRFGTDNPMKVNEVVQKGKETNLKKYGVEHLMQIPEVFYERMVKAKNTIYKNNNGAKSKQQIYLCNLFKGELNYPVNNCLLDIAFSSEMIYIEYNGSGHDLNVKLNQITQEEKNRKEINRFYKLRSQGWRLFKIISTKRDKLPNDKILVYFLGLAKYHLNHDCTYFELDIDNQTFMYSKNRYDLLLGKLRNIK